MHTLYRFDDSDQAGSGWFYREAWHDDAAGEFVIHHGALGANGKITAESVASAEEAETLMDSFLQQCHADGYAPAPPESQHEIVMSYPLKAAEPNASERRNAQQVHHAVLTALAWRGLGEISGLEPATIQGESTLAFTVRTLHRRKASEAARNAVKGCDVPQSKVRLQA
ncbi:MAG TPA: hypothetical protein H9871_03205 [Candidatus Nesterenkonia stercoripullorum]|uniref:WGR domain-containing protein n=1 Tax=Candidatus Nesterenkonia stercoripullorum TaxID=2838701 RepID=A0A9D1USF7_9MICC|nr:hypothetical protein [Candidatus Nesterenkonia stercoripullorum]